MAFNAKVRVCLLWDEELGRWDYTVPELHIVGGGGSTKEQALARAAESIAVALESDVAAIDPGVELGYVPIAVGA